jgi:hypothetical protein
MCPLTPPAVGEVAHVPGRSAHVSLERGRDRQQQLTWNKRLAAIMHANANAMPVRPSWKRR